MKIKSLLRSFALFTFVLLLGFVQLFLNTSIACAETDVEFIIDVSGSMREKLNGESQIDSARKALLNALDEIRPSQLVALRAYGHRVEQTKKDESCKDTELLIPFKKVDKAHFSEVTNKLTPKGYTPIAYSLQESRNDLLDVGVARESERVIILLTDGEETCGGDPVAVLKQLQAEGFKLTVYTVGFNVNDIARKQLKDIASITGGKYFDARNSGELNEALKSAAKESVVLLEKKSATYGAEIRGGDSYEQAVPIEFNKEYRLDHHQKKNDNDYFSFEVARGDQITIRLSTLTKGINLNGGKATETTHPYAGIQLHDSKRNVQKKIDIIGTPSKSETVIYRPTEDGKLYLVVGSTYEAMNKDNVTFQVTSEKKGDLGAEKDAGESFDKALSVEAKRYPVNYLGDSDKLDIYSFEAKAGDVYVLGVVPNGTAQSYFGVRLLDEFKQVIYSGSSLSNAGVRSKDVKIPEDGTYYFEIAYGGVDVVEYSIVIKKKENSAPAAEEGSGTPPGQGE